MKAELIFHDKQPTSANNHNYMKYHDKYHERTLNLVTDVNDKKISNLPPNKPGFTATFNNDAADSMESGELKANRNSFD